MGKAIVRALIYARAVASIALGVPKIEENEVVCEDDNEHCLAHWCANDHWANECQKTCGLCDKDTPVESFMLRSGGLFSGAPRDKTDKIVVLNYPAWASYDGFQVLDIDASSATHVNYNYANIIDGKCALGDEYVATQKFFASSDSWSDPPGTLRGNFKQLQVLKESFPHLKTMIALGGWEWSDQFHAVAATEASRTKFAESCVDMFVKSRYKFDGIELAWEYPVHGGKRGNAVGPEDRENFSLLLTAFRNALDNLNDGVHHPLSTTATNVPEDITRDYNVPEVASIVDFVNINSFDYDGAWSISTGHNAPLYPQPLSPTSLTWNVQNTVNKYLEAGLPKEKTILGLPFYGRAWINVPQGATDGLYEPGLGVDNLDEGEIAYSTLREDYIDNPSFTRYWDDSAKVPFLYNSDEETFISYDDEMSICYKLDFAMDLDLGGVMVWENSMDYQRVLMTLIYDMVAFGDSVQCQDLLQ